MSNGYNDATPAPEHRNAQVQGLCQISLSGCDNPLIYQKLDDVGGVQTIPLAKELRVPGSVFSGYFDVLIFTVPV